MAGFVMRRLVMSASLGLTAIRGRRTSQCWPAFGWTWSRWTRQLARLAVERFKSEGRDVPEVVVPTSLIKRSACRPFRPQWRWCC